MLSFVADENFNNDILRGVWRRNPSVDIVRVQDIGLSGADDATVLEWAAQQNRIVLTHDVTTSARALMNGLIPNSTCRAFLKSTSLQPRKTHAPPRPLTIGDQGQSLDDDGDGE